MFRVKSLCFAGRKGGEAGGAQKEASPLTLYLAKGRDWLLQAQGQVCSLIGQNSWKRDGPGESSDSSKLQGLQPPKRGWSFTCAYTLIGPLPVSFISCWPFLQEVLVCLVSSGHSGGQDCGSQNLVYPGT